MLHAIAVRLAAAAAMIGLLAAPVPAQFKAKTHAEHEKAATAGDTASMVELGHRYLEGLGVAQDVAKARTWFEKAAAAGNPAAMTTLGLLYTDGIGVQPDYAKAREWLTKAAAAGDRAAMHELGTHYAGGKGVPPDEAKATQWFEKAAAGEALAMHGIGDHYALGVRMPKSYAKARHWLEKAAAAGDTGALGDLSWHALMAGERADALDAAERALKASPDLKWIGINRAHALMLLGKAAEARAAYLAHKDTRLPQTGKTWQEAVADDFAELRKAGIEHPQMPEIETALGIGKK